MFCLRGHTRGSPDRLLNLKQFQTAWCDLAKTNLDALWLSTYWLQWWNRCETLQMYSIDTDNITDIVSVLYMGCKFV